MSQTRMWNHVSRKATNLQVFTPAILISTLINKYNANQGERDLTAVGCNTFSSYITGAGS